MSLDMLMKSLNVSRYPEALNELYPAAMEEYKNEGRGIVDVKRLSEINNKYRLFVRWWDDVLTAAAEAAKNSNLLKFIYLLKQVMKGSSSLDTLLGIKMPEDNANPLPYDFAPLFSMLPFIPKIAGDMKGRGVPDDIISATLKEFEEKTDFFYRQYKRPGIATLAPWLYKFINLEIIRVGRLNFEINKSFDGMITVYKNKSGEYKILMNDVETGRGIIYGPEYYEGYSVNEEGFAENNTVRLLKSEWQAVLTTGDKVISVHIPAGQGLSPDACEASYERVRRVLKDHYPEVRYNAFCCEHSWLMDPQLKGFLEKDSNILLFQKKYMLYPNKADGKSVFTFVFMQPDENIRLEDLPEDTRLMRAVKKHYLSGGLIYEHGGLFF